MGAHRRYINHHMLVDILAQIRMHVDLYSRRSPKQPFPLSVLFEEFAKAAIPSMVKCCLRRSRLNLDDYPLDDYPFGLEDMLRALLQKERLKRTVGSWNLKVNDSNLKLPLFNLLNAVSLMNIPRNANICLKPASKQLKWGQNGPTRRLVISRTRELYFAWKKATK